MTKTFQELALQRAERWVYDNRYLDIMPYEVDWTTLPSILAAYEAYLKTR
jgi:protein tyrosine phosphatase